MMPIYDDANLSAPHTQRELTQIAETSASVFSRQNALIDTLRAELAAEKAKSARLLGALTEIERKDDAGDYLYHRPGPFALVASAAIAAYEVKP